MRDLTSQPRSRRISLATGLEYHVLEWGADSADETSDHTVVLIHGFLDLAWGWAPLMDAWMEASNLAETFHVIAPDMRGHGDSDRVGAGGYYHFFDYLADLHSVIAQLGRATVSLVGHSMGGSIASYYAGAYPDAVHRLALLEGTGPPDNANSAAERIGPWVEGWTRARKRSSRIYPDIAAAAAQLRKHDRLLSAELADYLAERGTVAVENGRQFKHDSLHLTMGPHPFRVDVAAAFWQRVTCPVLLIEGAESNFRHAADESRRRAECFADHRRQTLASAGHMMQRHQPTALAEHLRAFLGDD